MPNVPELRDVRERRNVLRKAVSSSGGFSFGCRDLGRRHWRQFTNSQSRQPRTRNGSARHRANADMLRRSESPREPRQRRTRKTRDDSSLRRSERSEEEAEQIARQQASQRESVCRCARSLDTSV